MAAASTSHGGHRPWTAAAVTASRSGVSARRSSVGSAPVCARGPIEWPAARRRGPGRHAVAAKAGAAGERPSSSSSPPDAVSYSSSISTDMPLYEPPGVSFDEYLLDRARVFRAMFPDESRSQRLNDVSKPNHSPFALRLNDEEWRVQMLPLQFLLTVHPVVVMKLLHRDGVLDLRITEWELRGLERGYAPASFDLGVRGSLYADRSRGRRACRLRGHLEIAISCVLPPPMRLVPDAVMRGVAESVLQRLAEKMKQDVDVGIVADFQRFRREKAAASGKVNSTADRET